MRLRETILSFVCLVLICFLLMQKCNGDRQQHALELQLRVSSDSLMVARDALGRSKASIQNISTDYHTFQKLFFRDTLSMALQKSVSRRTIAAAVATTVIRVDTIIKIVEVVRSSDDSCNPTYSTLINEEWKSGIVSANKDSFSIHLKMHDQVAWMTEWSKWNLFKKRECRSQMLTANPDVEITGLRTYTVKCDCSGKSWLSFGLGSVAGFASGFGAGYVYRKQ